ncbi:MAG: anaerobic ribonucleoside-triphosphate reductase [Terriglobia bacterium]|jgi:DNA-directed RNA polymerase subunit RPC12/RpoP
MINSELLSKDISTSIVSYDRQEKYEMLRNLPENNTIYKCYHCKNIFNILHGGCINIQTTSKDGQYTLCPNCGEKNPELICKVDAYSVYLKLQGLNCRNGNIIPKTELCPVCNKPVCPDCYNHSVIALSRVTGYVQDISGWNNGKRQELLDRQRYTIANNIN